MARFLLRLEEKLVMSALPLRLNLRTYSIELEILLASYGLVRVVWVVVVLGVHGGGMVP